VDPGGRTRQGSGRARPGTCLPHPRHGAAGATQRRRAGPHRGHRPLHGHRRPGSARFGPDGAGARGVPPARGDGGGAGADRGRHGAGRRGEPDHPRRHWLDVRVGARCRPGPHDHGVRRTAHHAAVGDQLRSGRAAPLRTRLGTEACRRRGRVAAVARLVGRMARGDAGGLVRRLPVRTGGRASPRTRVLGNPGGAHRSCLVVLDAAAARRTRLVGTAGLPGVPDGRGGLALHGGVRPGDGTLRPRRGPAVRRPGRGARGGDLAGRIRRRDGRVRRAGARGHGGLDDPGSAPSTRPGPRHGWRPTEARRRPPRS
jgi:hypothetical protein